MNKFLFPLLLAFAVLTGCTTIELIFVGSDAGPAPDAGTTAGDSGGIIPLADAARLDPDAGPLGSDAGPPAPVAVIATFGGSGGTLVPSGFYPELGNICFTAYGGGARVTLIETSGTSLPLFQQLMVMDEPSGFVGMVDVATSHAIPVDIALTEGVSRCFDFLGAFARPEVIAPFYGGPTVNFTVGRVAAERIDGTSFEATVSRVVEPQFFVHWVRPIVTGRALASSAITNGIRQNVFSIEITGAFSRPLTLGSLTFSVQDVRRLSDFRVSVGSTELPSGSYRVLEPVSGTDLTAGTLTRPAGGELARVTIVFTPGFVPPFEIGGSPSGVITTSAVPSDFVAGDIMILGFNYSVSSAWPGMLVADGRIDFVDPFGHGPEIDSFVWTYDLVSPSWFGSSPVYVDGALQTLTR